MKFDFKLDTYHNREKHNNIKTHLHEKYILLNSLLPEQDICTNTYIAGGSIYSLYNNEKVNDYDIFCKSKQDVARLSKFIKNNIESLESKGYKVFITSFAITIQNNEHKFQIITKYFGKPEDVIAEFDCLHNMSYYDYNTNKLHILSDEQYLDSKVLRFNNKRCRDLCQSILRISKYSDRGFKIYKSEIRNMLLKLYDTGFDEVEMELLKSRNEY